MPDGDGGSPGRCYWAARCVAAGYLAWPRATPDAPPAREVPLTTLQGYETSPTLAPDGEQVAFSWGGPNQDNVDIYIQRIGSGTEVRRTVHSARDFSPAWSPDGRWIAFLRGEVPGRSELILIPPLGGAELRLAEIHIPNQIWPNYLSWFPDSSALVVVHAQQYNLFVFNNLSWLRGWDSNSVSPVESVTYRF